MNRDYGVIGSGLKKKRMKDSQVADKIADKVADKTNLTSSEKAFLELLLPYFTKYEWITNSTARELSGNAEGSVKRFLRVLTDKNVLEARGENKARQYRLTSLD